MTRARAAVADATLATGATLLLLYSTQAGSVLSLIAGVTLIVLGALLLWGTPRPDLRSRLLASISGLFIGFGLATWGSGTGAAYALGAGALLLASTLVSVTRPTRRG